MPMYACWGGVTTTADSSCLSSYVIPVEPHTGHGVMTYSFTVWLVGVHVYMLKASGAILAWALQHEGMLETPSRKHHHRGVFSHEWGRKWAG